LPPASFRFRLAADTLALGCALPAAGRARDFHPLETCACSAHKEAPLAGRASVPLVGVHRPTVERCSSDTWNGVAKPVK